MPSKKHHVFLFRHCVRSTPATFKLYNETVIAETKYDAGDFTSSPLPNWNVPTKWCTEVGMEIMTKIASSIIKDILASVGEGSVIQKMQVVTDASQRDVDTSFALYRGIRDVALADNNTQIMTLGLSDLVYDPSLFDPLSGVNPFCTREYSTVRLLDDIIHRLRSVPPPEANLRNTLLALERIGGIGASGSLTLIQPNSYFDPKPTSDKIKLQGAINIVKLFAQMMFYSRAGGVRPPFLPNATSKDVYRFIEWIDWSSSVLRVDNVESATKGVVMTNAILEALEHGCYNVKDSNSRCFKEYDSSATFFVGHDSDFANVATALGIRWKLEPPYKSGTDGIGEYVPIPPGASMHFEYDLATGVLDLSYLYPVFPMDKTNTDFALRKVPLGFSPPLSDMGGSVKISKEGASTLISPKKNSDKNASLEALRKRLLSALNKFPEATNCYYKATNQSHSLMLGIKTEFSLSSMDSKLSVVYYASHLAVVLFWFLSYFLIYKKKVKAY